MRTLQQPLGWLFALFRRLQAPGPRWPALTPVANGVEKLVHLLDSAIPIPGTRFRLGLDPVLGLMLPAVGDTVGGIVSLGVIFLAVQYRVPSRVIARMVFNVVLDAAVGSIPIAGDLFDFGFKANDRNFKLMMKHRGDQPKRASLGYWLSVGGLFAVGVAFVAAPLALFVWLFLKWSGG